MNETKILTLFQSNKSDKAFQLLYDFWPQFLGYVKNQGGSKEQAEDIYQEAIIIFYKKLREEDFQFEGSLKTYLFNTAKYMWWRENRLDENSKVSTVSEQSFDGAQDDKELEAAIEKEMKIQKAEKVIESLGEKCKEILEAFYYQGLKMVEIAKKFGYASPKTAKNQKYKCLERARKQLLNA